MVYANTMHDDDARNPEMEPRPPLGHVEMASDGLTEADAGRPEQSPEEPPAPEVSSDAVHLALRKYLSFSDSKLSDEEKTEIYNRNYDSPQAWKYAQALAQIAAEPEGQARLNAKAEEMKDKCLRTLQRANITATEYSKSQSWAMWDLGRQEYYRTHPDDEEERREQSPADEVTPEAAYQLAVDQQVGAVTMASLQQPGVTDALDPALREQISQALPDMQVQPDGSFQKADLRRLGGIVSRFVEDQQHVRGGLVQAEEDTVK